MISTISEGRASRIRLKSSLCCGIAFIRTPSVRFSKTLQLSTQLWSYVECHFCNPDGTIRLIAYDYVEKSRWGFPSSNHSRTNVAAAALQAALRGDTTSYSAWDLKQRSAPALNALHGNGIARISKYCCHRIRTAYG